MEEKRFWNEEVETQPIEKLHEHQVAKLQDSIGRAYEKTTFYRKLFNEAGVKPEDISTTDDLRKLPFTTDIEVAIDVPLKDRLAISEDEIKMFHSTSGTVGAVVPIPFSQKDKDNFFSEGECRARWTMGARPSDVVQVLTQFDCCLMGYKQLGASIVMLSAGRYNPQHQMQLTRDAGVTIIEHMPSFLLNYFETMEKNGIPIRETNLRMVSGVGEGWAESYKKKVEDKYNLPFMTLYGAVEISPFFASECSERNGMHINADFGILEIVDPDTDEPLAEGEEGELVVTLIQNEAMPLIRYKVGDIGKILPYEVCPCGRTTPKLSYVKGRSSQILKIGGKKILPIDVEEIVAKIDDLENEFRIVMDKPETDFLKLKVEYKPEVKDVKGLRDRVEEMTFDDLGIKSEVNLLSKGSLERVTFKAQRVENLY